MIIRIEVKCKSLKEVNKMNYEKVDSVNSTRSVQLRQKKIKQKLKKKLCRLALVPAHREFMCVAQVKRMSKNNHSKAGYRVHFEG